MSFPEEEIHDVKLDAALTTVSSAITLALSSASPAKAIPTSAPVGSRNAAAAACLGPSATYIKVEVEGWGADFELRTRTATLLIDLRDAADEMVDSVLRQADTMIQVQTIQRVRAGRLGLSAPLRRDEFMDLSRMRIDIAAAKALREVHGCDRSAARWLRDQLGLVWDARRGARAGEAPEHPVLRLRRTTIAIPFRIGSSAIADGPTPSSDHPLWIDNEVRVARPREASIADMRATAERLLAQTPLAGRDAVYETPWPPADFLAAVKVHERETGQPFPYRIASHWRMAVEPRHVGAAEAFE